MTRAETGADAPSPDDGADDHRERSAVGPGEPGAAEAAPSTRSDLGPAGASRRRRRRRGREAKQEGSRLARAQAELAGWFRERMREELGSGIGVPPDLEVSFPMPLPLSGPPRPRHVREVEQLAMELWAELRDQLRFAALGYPAGHVHCNWCEAARCEHSWPPTPHSVFVGYDPTGTPRWRDFASWVVERRDPRLDRLAGSSPTPLAILSHGEELHRDLLPEFRRESGRYRILAQLAAGIFGPPPSAGGDTSGRAFSIQAVEHRRPGGRRTLSLNVVGLDTDAEQEYAGTGSILVPWLNGMRRALRETEETVRSRKRKGRPLSDGRIHILVRRVLEEAFDHLEKSLRRGRRRTRHAEERTLDPERPTASARTDACRAADERMYFDPRQDTVIVRGPRHRVHVFRRDGTHITSIIYTGKSVRERIERKRWLPLDRADCAAFRAALRDTGGAESPPI